MACGGGGGGGTDTGTGTGTGTGTDPTPSPSPSPAPGTTTQSLTSVLLAGSYGDRSGGVGNENAAQFDWMGGIAVDNADNVYVTQPSQGTIRKITSTGMVSTLAGTVGTTGNVDAPGAAARFSFPWGLAIDGSGHLYVADFNNNSIRKISPTGIVTTVSATVGSPQYIAADDVGKVYKINLGSSRISETGARLDSIAGIAVDKSGNVFLADSNDHTIHRVSPSGTMSLLAGSSGVEGNTDGLGSAARFRNPQGLATDSDGNVYVADSGNNMIRKISPSGSVSTLAGATYWPLVGMADGAGTVAQFRNPTSVATDSVGNIYVADSGNFTVRKISPGGQVTTLAGTAHVMGTKDGTTASIQLHRLKGVTAGSNGNLYVADGGDHTVRQVTPSGLVSTLAGTSGRIGSNDGIGATASFNGLTGTAADQDGNVYVADAGNHTVRKIDPSGIVTTLAGKAGLNGTADGTGESARFRKLAGLATDSAGNVYVADLPDWGDTGGFAIRRITTQGVVSTVMQPSNLAYLKDITVDVAGNLYFIAQDRADTSFTFSTDYSDLSVFKLTPTGQLSTMGKTSTGTKAIFSNLSGITVDRLGNVYVASSMGIQKITPTGAVSTLMTKLVMDYGDYDGMYLTTRGTTLYFTTTHGVHALKNALP